MGEITEYPRVNVLGVGVSAINMQQALTSIDSWITQGAQKFITVTGVHGVIESQKDELVRQIHNEAALVTPDGMPLVWLSRLAGHSHVTRVYGPDLMLAVCRVSLEKGYKHFFYGAGEGTPELLATKLKAKYPSLNIVGMYSPPFRELTDEEDNNIVDMINASRADIVWIGLSTPKQEKWMYAHLGKLSAPLMIGVGAAFDFHAEIKKQAPKWMQSSGLEWLFRMASEPRRLGKRYIVNNPLFLILVLSQLLKIKQYDIGKSLNQINDSSVDRTS